jgi:hypothetical protein
MLNGILATEEDDAGEMANLPDTVAPTRRQGRAEPPAQRGNKMRKVIARSSFVVFGLLALGALTVQAQYDQRYEQQSEQRYNPQSEQQSEQRYARPRDLLALQDDLVLLDDSLSAVPQRHPRYQEFQDRADAIRRDVTALADQMRRHREDRREGVGGGQAEVAALRQSIAMLRDDLENAQSRRGGRDEGVFLVPAGTDIQVMLDQDLSSRSSNPEDRVEASTVAAIRLNGRTVIPAGATVSGFVREVRSRHRGQQDGWLRLDFDSLTPEGGPGMDMRSHVVSIAEMRSRDNTLRNAGLGALLGGVVGGIIDGRRGTLIGAAVGAGGGLLASQGDDVDLPEGTLITLRLDEPMTLARRSHDVQPRP